MKKVLTILLCGIFLVGVVGCEEKKVESQTIDTTEEKPSIDESLYLGEWKSVNEDKTLKLELVKDGTNVKYSLIYLDSNEEKLEEINGMWNFDYTSFTTRDDDSNAIADYTISKIVYGDNEISFDVSLKKVNNEDNQSNVIPDGSYKFSK